MRIKKLELLGFKSFKDKTVISFDEGITGIVGPNGCGKSNIVDALVWVMGEMSAKHLRGSSMEDVIFAGSQDYAPTGMAEVSLTLENDGGAFPVRYLNHSEVMVTRRLHRSGESEYLINKEPSRLRDIQEIFMDTGAGSKGFSIIEQGQIGKIITSKPSERRSLIEEAAGITKFKARKKESERKLKATDQNLVRLADIIRELKRQLDSLERQAQKAERYRKLKNELKEKELWMAALEITKGQETFGTLSEQITELQDKDHFLETEIQKLQAQIEEEKTGSVEKEKELELKQNDLKEISEKVLNFENEIREIEFELEQTKRSKEIKGSVSEQSMAKLQVLLGEKEELETRYNDVKTRFEVIDQEYSTLDERFQTHQEEIQSKEDLLTTSRKTLLEIHQGLSHLKAITEGIDDKIQNLSQELAERKETQEEIESKKTDFQKRYDSLSKDYEEQKQLKLGFLQDVETISENLENVKAQQEEILSQKEEETRAFNIAHSKLTTLKELQEQFEGYQEGVKNLLLAKKEQGIAEPGQPLSDFINAPEDYADAIETCLADGLEGLFGARSLSDLSQSLDCMKSDNKGRVQFLISELFDGAALNTSQRTLADYATSQAENIKNLLSHFYLVESQEEAFSLLKEHKGFCILKSGEMLTSLGQFYTGRSGSGAGLLMRKQSIEELTKEEAQRQTNLDSLEREIKKNKDRIEQLSTELDAARVKDNEQELKVFELRKDLERAEYEKQKADVEVEKILKSVSEVEDKLQKTIDQQDEHKTSIRDLEVRREEQDQMAQEAEEGLIQLKENYSGLQNEVTNKKIEHASLKSEYESLEQRLTSLNANEDQLQAEISSLQEESAESETFISTYASDLELKKAQLENDIEKRQELQAIVSKMRDDYEQLTATERELSKQITDYTIEKSKVDSKLSEFQVKSEQSRLGLQASVDQMFDRYSVDLTETYEDYLGAYEEENKSEVKDSMLLLRDKISRMGEVNLSAIHEFDDIKQRHEFLSEQQTDLLNAKKQLERVITRIDRICSRRFRDTFEAVNERFKKVFPVLFGGGEARLILIESEEDDKEPGIDIEAKPPGKKAQNVSLLSGGEKALTAVSLIFSIFLVKPSPYCLLDEVDAPLDDANVFRFNELVKEMAKRSQIILVTHNKNTMAVNNKLYGVTQEEKGVSKMVSVDLDGNFLKEVTATA